MLSYPSMVGRACYVHLAQVQSITPGVSGQWTLKLSSSPRQDSEVLARKGHLLGMKPMIQIDYIHSINFYRWKPENLQILLEAAPMLSRGWPNCLVVVGGDR